MKIAIAQLNPVIGDLRRNFQKLLAALDSSRKDRPDLLIFPELFLTGYPPKDLLEKRDFIKRVQKTVREIQSVSVRFPGTGILFGVPLPTGRKEGRGLHNSALLIKKGKILFRQNKTLL
ncbi:MAG TPA: nitrilase-related carbon-nitrogen hydrolase, partial [bacterium]|nr:nitrilase-related carbon-nitrogen hydrolase [bacterium]